MSEKEVLAAIAEVRESIDDLTIAVTSVSAAVAAEEPVVVDASLPPPSQVSPAMVLEAEGWFEQQGLKLSNARSFGCHKIAKRYITGRAYRDNAKAVAGQFNASERLIRMLGHHLLINWYMFPMEDLSPYGGRKFFRTPYTPIQPEVPYNDEEKRIAKENFLFSHMSGKSLTSGALQEKELYITAQLEAPDRERFVGAMLPPEHRIYTVPNSPHKVIPDVVALYANDAWLRFEYRKMLAAAHAIDKGERDQADYPGYATPFDQGGSMTRGWYDEHEDGAPSATPKLKALS